jgi:hypothetical protein
MTEPMRQPLPGDLGLAPGGGFAMAFVRWGTGVSRLKHGRFFRHHALYGHAALCVAEMGEGSGEVEIIEATPGGVIKRNVPIPHFDWSTGGDLTVQFDAGIASREIAVAKMHELLGKGYDWPNILRFVAEWAWPGFAGQEDEDNKKVICSEACTWALREAGATCGVLGGDKPAGRVSPNDLAPLMAFWPKTQPSTYGL